MAIEAGDATSAGVSDRPLRMAGLAIACVAHAFLLYAVSRQPDDAFGAGGQILEAISVELVTANVLESRAAETGTSAAAAFDVSEATGGIETTAAAEEAERKQPRETARQESKPEDKVEPSPDAEIPADVAVLPPPPEAPPAPEQPSPDAELQHEPVQQDSSAGAEASQQGGSAARGTDDTSSRASAAAAASPGVAREYGKAVLRALSRSKPKAPGGLGTVWIQFVVGNTGALAEVHVSAPSGKAKLDEAALDAVRRARLPPPPAGLSTAQLTFRIPYYFR